MDLCIWQVLEPVPRGCQGMTMYSFYHQIYFSEAGKKIKGRSLVYVSDLLEKKKKTYWNVAMPFCFRNVYGSQSQRWKVVTEITGPTKPQVFTLCSLEERWLIPGLGPLSERPFSIQKYCIH